MLRVRRTEFIWAVVAMLGVMVLGTLQGILVAIIVLAWSRSATRRPIPMCTCSGANPGPR